MCEHCYRCGHSVSDRAISCTPESIRAHTNVGIQDTKLDTAIIKSVSSMSFVAAHLDSRNSSSVQTARSTHPFVGSSLALPQMEQETPKWAVMVAATVVGSLQCSNQLASMCGLRRRYRKRVPAPFRTTEFPEHTRSWWCCWRRQRLLLASAVEQSSRSRP
jgi:hypothetical protein